MFCRTLHFSKSCRHPWSTFWKLSLFIKRYLYCHFVPLLDVGMKDKRLCFHCVLHTDNPSANQLLADILEMQGRELPKVLSSLFSLATMAKYWSSPPCHYSQTAVFLFLHLLYLKLTGFLSICKAHSLKVQIPLLVFPQQPFQTEEPQHCFSPYALTMHFAQVQRLHPKIISRLFTCLPQTYTHSVLCSAPVQLSICLHEPCVIAITEHSRASAKLQLLLDWRYKMWVITSWAHLKVCNK